MSTFRWERLYLCRASTDHITVLQIDIRAYRHEERRRLQFNKFSLFIHLLWWGKKKQAYENKKIFAKFHPNPFGVVLPDRLSYQIFLQVFDYPSIETSRKSLLNILFYYCLIPCLYTALRIPISKNDDSTLTRFLYLVLISWINSKLKYDIEILS